MKLSQSARLSPWVRLNHCSKLSQYTSLTQCIKLNQYVRLKLGLSVTWKLWDARLMSNIVQMSNYTLDTRSTRGLTSVVPEASKSHIHGQIGHAREIGPAYKGWLSQ